MFWLLGLTFIGLAMATIGAESSASDEGEEADAESLEDRTPFGEAEPRCIPEGPQDETQDNVDGFGSDTGEGTAEKDLIFSESSDGAHFSVVHGNEGNDRIYASDGAQVFGGLGGDMIVLRDFDGSGCAVEASGDEGGDAFLIEVSDCSSSVKEVDTIVDYRPGEDLVGIIMEDETFGDGQHNGSISFNLKSVAADIREDGTLLTILIGREVDPDIDSTGDENTSDLTHQVFLKGALSFDPKDIIIVTDWIAFANQFLGSEGYGSVLSPKKATH